MRGTSRHEPPWFRLFVDQIGQKWAVMVLADDAPPPAPAMVKGLAFCADTSEEAGDTARVYLGCAEPAD